GSEPWATPSTQRATSKLGSRISSNTFGTFKRTAEAPPADALGALRLHAMYPAPSRRKLFPVPEQETTGPASRVYFSQRLRLHYVDWGNAAAPPLILLHGIQDHCRNWDWVAQRLRHEWHVIAPDLRGHGDSQWSATGSYTMAGYIYDLAQLIDL